MAARFKFRLESLLKLRHSLEEEAQRHLARMSAQVLEAESRIEALHQSRRDSVEGRRTGARQVIDLDHWRATERFLLVLERRLQWAQEDLRQARERVLQARQALLKAHQAHLMLVRLKERRHEQHLLELQRDEAREMDEIAVLRYRISHA